MDATSPNVLPKEMDDERTSQLVLNDDKEIQNAPSKEIVSPDPKPAAARPEITGLPLVFILGGLLATVFVVSLDLTIVGTALPRIASDFNALQDMSWVVNAFLLTQTVFMLPYSFLMVLFSVKYLYILAIIIFEVGSLMCALAPSMPFLIFARAVAGVGTAGAFVGGFVILALIAPVNKRPLLFSILTIALGIASVVGPLVGGAFTDHVTWRWCFYINIPFGVLAVALLTFSLPKLAPPVDPNSKLGPISRLKGIDGLGVILLLATLTCFLLPIQWGGSIKPWNAPSTIVLLVLSSVFFVAFVYWELRRGDKAFLPMKFLLNRTQVGSCLEVFMLYIGLLLGVYYLPFYYQARGSSATSAGVHIIPFMLSFVISNLVSATIVKRTGHYWSWLFGGPLLSCVAFGLLFTINDHTTTAKLCGYQILMGVGIGSSIGNTLMALQCEFRATPKIITQATALNSFFQKLGGIIGIAIAGAVFSNQLEQQLRGIPNLSPDVASQVRQSVAVIAQLDGATQVLVRQAYINALRFVFLIGIPAGAFSSLSAFLIRNHSMKA